RIVNACKAAVHASPQKHALYISAYFNQSPSILSHKFGTLVTSDSHPRPKKQHTQYTNKSCISHNKSRFITNRNTILASVI
ncbi:hypothetical protein, partial [Morganella morganii]|uniref:hypothetical protein n=1 Tax=Morganella morganii TaxID=582 RepID=UPI001952A283